MLESWTCSLRYWKPKQLAYCLSWFFVIQSLHYRQTNGMGKALSFVQLDAFIFFFFCNFIWISYCTRAKLDLCEKTLSRSETWKSIHLIISPRCTAPLRLQYNLYLMRHVLSAQISLFWGIWNLPDVTHGVAPTVVRDRGTVSPIYTLTFSLTLHLPSVYDLLYYCIVAHDGWFKKNRGSRVYAYLTFYF